MRAVDARGWRRLIGSVRVGLSVITAVLLGVGVLRAIGDGAPWGWVLAVSAIFAGWYAGGVLFRMLGADIRNGVRARWWLVGLTLAWAGAVAVSAEFVWLAFPLWLLAGFVLPLGWALTYSVLVFGVVVGAPLLQSGDVSYPSVIGPLVGGIFALGISRGYLELIRDGRERRRLVESLLAAQREMAELQDELARTQRDSGAGAERTRLSRDIHDTVAQSLSSIGMIARSARAMDASGAAAETADRNGHRFAYRRDGADAAGRRGGCVAAYRAIGAGKRTRTRRGGASSGQSQ